MAKMDHTQAIQLQAAVKYVLGELSQVQREEFEEHYFDCAECAIDLKTLATFADTTREVLRQEKASAVAADPVPVRGGWLRWLQPVLATACAALLLLVGYQSLVSIPHWKGLATHSAPLAVQAVQVAAPNGLPVFSLQTANRRGGANPVFQAKAGESFALKVDITDPDASVSFGYLLRLDDGSGAARVLVTVSREEARNTVFVEVPAGFPAGNAKLVVLGTPQPAASARTVREITSIPFVVAFETDIEHHP
jgi:hypothetical protein